MPGLIYLDYAATSHRRPETVVNAVTNYLRYTSANPGRSGHHLSAAAARVVFDAREAVSRLLNIPDSRQLVFTKNATEAINIVLSGFLSPGDRVVATSMEHNAVMRPLRYLAEALPLELEVVPAGSDGIPDPQAVGNAARDATKLVVVNHASNVCGSIAPLKGIRQAIGDIPLLVDAAQTAGALPIDVQSPVVDFLALTGHKALLGPQGTGALYVRKGLEQQLKPLLRGGTGSRSEYEEQPEILPDKLEGGTLNAPGIAGLGAGAQHLLEQGVDEIREHEIELTGKLMEGLSTIQGLQLFGPADPRGRMPVVSFSIEGLEPGLVSQQLDREFGIMSRAGLHCAPSAHRTLGTFPQGTVRLSAGLYTTPEEIDAAVSAAGKIAGSR